MLVDYLQKDVMVFRVYGFADVKPKQKKEKPKAKPPISSFMDQSTSDSANLSNASVTS